MKNSCPVDEETRLFVEENFQWFLQEFGNETFLSSKTFLPTTEFFPIKFNGEESLINPLKKIISNSMDINDDKIDIIVFDRPALGYNTGTSTLFTKEEEDQKNTPNGLYYGANNKTGVYEIAISKDNLFDGEKLISTLVHEFAHIKLLGENRLEENDEYITDLLTVFYGFGIFGANCSFRFINASNHWGYDASGYLNHWEWGYGLALYAYLRGKNNPEWINYIESLDIKKAVEKGLLFLNESKHISPLT